MTRNPTLAEQPLELTLTFFSSFKKNPAFVQTTPSAEVGVPIIRKRSIPRSRNGSLGDLSCGVAYSGRGRRTDGNRQDPMSRVDFETTHNEAINSCRQACSSRDQPGWMYFSIKSGLKLLSTRDRSAGVRTSHHLVLTPN